MRLQKKVTRKREDAPDYYVYLVTLPSDKIKKLGWKEGDELTANLVPFGSETALALLRVDADENEED